MTKPSTVPVSRDILEITVLSLKQSTLYMATLAKAIQDPAAIDSLQKSRDANMHLISLLERALA